MMYMTIPLAILLYLEIVALIDAFPTSATTVKTTTTNGEARFEPCFFMRSATSGWKRRRSNIDHDDDRISSLRKRIFAHQYGLYEVQEETITRRAQVEEEIMQGPFKVIEANKPKGTGSSGGFGGSSSRGAKKSSSSALKAQAKSHAKVLQDEGVVRIDDVLTPELCDELKSFVINLRKQSEEDVSSNKIAQQQRFANVLLRKNRCDLTMPLCDITYRGLLEALCKSSVGHTFEKLLGKDALLYEFSCLISDGGSDRQVVHPDTPFQSSSDDPVLYTCFMALQDIDSEMGPTLWIPRSHTRQVHAQFQDDTKPSNGDGDLDSPKEAFLRKAPYVLGQLPKGACGIFDSRLLHCGTANRSSGTSRAIFYVSFKNPSIGYPGNPASIRPQLQNKLTLGQLQKQLDAYSKKKNYSDLERIASTMK